MAEMKLMTLANLEYFTSKLDVKFDEKVSKETGKGLSTNDYTTTEKNKLAGIATGAQVNVIESIKVNGTEVTPSAKSVNIDLSGYALKSDIVNATHWKGTVATVSALPESPEIGDIYHVSADGGEYIWNGTTWEFVGTIVDLSDYYTKGQIDTKLDAKANTSSLATVATTGSYNDLTDKPNIPEGTTVDTALSTTSGNPVQNKIITAELNKKVNSTDLVAITTDEIDAIFA